MSKRRRPSRAPGMFDRAWEFPAGPEFPPAAAPAAPAAPVPAVPAAPAMPAAGGAPVRIEQGDCRGVMAALAAEGVRVDAIVTDPPYELDFMGAGWDRTGIAYDAAVWRGCLALLRPGGHLLAFGGTRTYHRMAGAIEDAGFQIRDLIAWLYGSGFPKSRDLAKAMDSEAGVTGSYGAPKSAAHAGWIDRGAMRGGAGDEGWQRPWMDDAVAVDRAARDYLPATDAGRRWKGWGTALKPALEPIVVARKPFDGTVAANVRAHGTGALNIDGCRVPGEKPQVTQGVNGNATSFRVATKRRTSGDPHEGRWPANLIHDGSDEVTRLFPASDGGGDIHKRSAPKTGGIYGEFAGEDDRWAGYGDQGTAARFFYSAKADAGDRLGSKHPTVKPVDLIAYLCRLVTPPGGVVLDPFAGSGTTAMACLREGFGAIVIDLRAECIADMRRRLAHVTGADTPLFRGEP